LANALRDQHMEAVKLLIEGRADLNVPSKVGESRTDSKTMPAHNLEAFFMLSELGQSKKLKRLKTFYSYVRVYAFSRLAEHHSTRALLPYYNVSLSSRS
jgi:hypothetical protein